MSNTLGIIGVGLIGGSVGLAAGYSGWEVVGLDTPEVLENATQSGAIHRASTLKEVREADLVVLAAPISKVTDLLGDLTPTNALITDVASAKSAIVRRAESLKLRFVGGHPALWRRQRKLEPLRGRPLLSHPNEPHRSGRLPRGRRLRQGTRRRSYRRRPGEARPPDGSTLPPAPPHGGRAPEGRLGHLSRGALLRRSLFQGPDQGGRFQPGAVVGHPGRERLCAR